jgi:soluble lytic murein transglycosylase-like protein
MPFRKPRSIIRVLAVLSAALAAATLTVVVSSCMSAAAASEPEAYVPEEFRKFSSYDETQYVHAFRSHAPGDVISASYEEPLHRESVLAFFSSITKSRPIAQAILDNALEYAVPPSLAFALAYEESQFNPRAINRNAESVDRGLFQLNSKSFPNMTIEQFYDPVLNARKGVAHLAYCLEEGGNEVAALAIYNAGYGRVSKGGTPRKTLDYIARITKYASNLESLFEAQVVARHVAMLKDGTRAE